MGVEFEISAEGVNNAHNGRGVAEGLPRIIEQGFSCGAQQNIETNPTIALDESPECGRNSEDDMLVGDVEEV